MKICCETVDEWKQSLCERLWKEEGNLLELDEIGRRDEIAKKAYEMWQEAGCPPGDGFDFWIAAENEIDEALFD